jgi:hypothetical protein
MQPIYGGEKITTSAYKGLKNYGNAVKSLATLNIGKAIADTAKGTYYTGKTAVKIPTRALYHGVYSPAKYIGKKAFQHTTSKKLGKKELAEIPVTRGKRPSKKTVVKESDWKTYYGSNTEVKSLPKDELKRYVLMLCRNKKELTYYETKYLFTFNVLENDSYMNDNILGRFFRKDLISAE